MKIHEAAEIILRKERSPLHISRLVELIEGAGLFRFGAKNPESALDTALARRCRGITISKHSGEFVFYRAAPATYGLLKSLSDNPGRGVSEVLRMLYNTSNEPAESLLHQVDVALASEGSLIQSVRDSIIYYMTRRLISYSIYRYRYFKKNEIDDGNLLRKDLGSYLKDQANIDDCYHGLLIELLIESAKARNRKIPNGLRISLLEKAKSADRKCYLCGCDLDFENSGRDNSIQLEHIWPRSLGGASIESNLKAACHKCNQKKAAHVNSADAHFKSVCFITDESEPSFLRELNHCDKLTLLAKNECRCSICNSPAETVGKLYVSRANRGDILHYFNVINTCSEHGGRN